METTPDSSNSTAATEADRGTPPAGGQHRLVKNTLYLTVAQASTIPLSVASNALAGRYLGPEEFGYIYIASTVCAFGALAFEWGQQGAVPALVARDNGRSGVYLGTSLSWRAMASLPVALVLAAICWLLGYERGALWAVALSFPAVLLNSLGAGMKDTIRGFERTDIPAKAHVAQQVGLLLVAAPVLVLGGHLRSLLLSQIAVGVFTVLYLRSSLGSVGVSKLKFDRNVLKPLFAIGTPFVFFDLAMVLLPNVNAAFLTKLVPPEVIGWYGVSQRLVGLIVFPASALIGALYPTLCRLQSEDPAEFVRVSRSSLYGVSLLAIPAALGCGLFPELGVSIFGSVKFAGALDHLRVLSVFVFLVYFSMPLGTSILASNRQKSWALVQCICIVVSLIGSPLLIPIFQRRMHNGAIGTCITLVLSEVFVVACGFALAPRGLVNRQLVKSLCLAALAGVAMAGVAVVTKPISLFLAVPAALFAYGVVAWFSGAVQPTTIDMVKGFVARKLKRT